MIALILRTIQLCSAILTEDHVNLTRFDKYLEGYLKKDDAFTKDLTKDLGLLKRE